VRSVPNSIVKTGIFGDPEKLHYDDRTRYELYQCEEDNSLKEPELLRFYYMSSVFKPARMSRSDRRRILALLESYPEQALYDDMHRYRAVWVRLGEVLHPSEYARRYPKVERVFASLRKKLVNGASLVRRQTWQSKVEAALRDRRIDDAVSMLAERPGEFARKLSRLIAIVGENDDDNAKNVAKSSFSPPVSRNSTQSVASRMSRSAARAAATRERMAAVRHESISLRPALLAAGKRACRSSRRMTDRYIAANASQRCRRRTNSVKSTEHPRIKWVFFCAIVSNCWNVY